MTKHTCETCGATLPAPGAPCRRCLMELAASPEGEGKPEPVATGAPRPGTPPPEPGELAPLFPELEIGALLGAGGMGAVYRARQKRLGREVALKVLHAGLSNDPVFVERFLREAQAMARLAHPGIVAVHDYGEREKRCYLVMEYVDGANLRALLKQGLLEPRQALDIVRQLCDALQFAHDEGVVHRDIKPENVLVDAKGRVKVADFGLAKLVGARGSVTLTDAGQVMGTPHYMAPEQVERPRDVDHRADLFSLGVVFYEMLTGELPLGRFAPPSQRVQVDVRLDEIVLKTLERERERRYQQAAQVKTDVERVEQRPGRTGAPRRPRLRSGVYLPSPLGGHRPTAWGWFAVCSIAWIACAASFNLGPVWCALISLPLLASVFLSMVAARTGTEPDPGDESERASVFFSMTAGRTRTERRWITRFDPMSFLLAGLGVATVFVTLVAGWERRTWSYDSSDQRPLAGLERWRGSEIELMRAAGLQPERLDVEPDELRLEASSSHWLSNPYVLFGQHPVVPGLVACALLTLGALLTSRAARRPAREWRAGVLSSLALFLCPLAGLHLASFAIHGGTQRLEAVQARQQCAGAADEIGQRLYRALLAEELQVHAEHSAQIVDRRTGTALASVHLLAAGQASVFARWRMTPGGPQRVEPHVNFTVVSDDRELALILADGGLAEPEHALEGEWESTLRAILLAACAGEPSK